MERVVEDEVIAAAGHSAPPAVDVSIGAAQKRIDERLAAGGVATGPLTVADWAGLWIPERRALDLDWKNDEGRLRHHVLPVIGHMPLAEVRTIDIVNLFRRIRTVPRPGRDEPASQRLVYNIYSVVAAMFRDAQLADRIERSPCVLGKRQLGPLNDKNPSGEPVRCSRATRRRH